MSNGYSDAIKEAYSICPSGETLVDTLEIRHPDKESIFIVRDQIEFTACLENGQWVFENSSASLVDKVNNRLLTLQSGATVQPTYTESGVTISTAVGNNAYSILNAPARKATFAEAVIFNKALTLDEIKAVATRSKDRMKNRGIIF
ncbi:DUF1833 family protein [Acinetobacter baumannii]|uniref:DUF1833 family protein n=2 Tax=Acinetobacter baumannii TaxID=470 RepID=UPI00059B00B1|nr:DUF1833 family protein [Acinetobacter baumannii]MBF8314600.1 DUF1833 family protein [Acinetobacter baumannii]MBU0308272.1 DUF1833 domain-containing protein [Acinetobacter baumannii]MBU0330599.1 DUF1833 domain-containing protein [Acinetobacter baumannii]MCJ9456304.1 DUF1833 domain-containing protein [Acinetobacter baumannii]MCJ9538647.1 DUF1833 domain-containing protein [Acinetobacter baumannii]